MMRLCIALFMAAVLVGCATPHRTSLSEVEDNWEAHSVYVPKNIHTLTLVGIHMDFRWIAAGGIGYRSGEGQLLRRDAWRAILVSDSGTIRQISAVMGDACVNVTAMVPNTSPEEIIGKHLFVFSGGNEGHSKSLLTTSGKIIGPLARSFKDREEIDLVKLEGDPEYRSHFLARYPSVVSRDQVMNASPGTNVGDRFLADMKRRFPVLVSIDGKTSAVSPQAEYAAGETNQATTTDKVFSNTRWRVGPGIAAWPIGTGMALANLLLASWYAADMPLHGPFEGARHSELDIVDTVGECHARLVARLKSR